MLLHFKYFPISKKKCFTNNRSSHQRCSMKKGVLKNFTKFTGKHLCQSLFYNKFAGLSPATLIKKRLWHRCFPVSFVKLLITTFLQNTSGPHFWKKTDKRKWKWKSMAILKTSYLAKLIEQKQPSTGVLSKKCSENMQQIYRSIPMQKCDFNIAAKQLYWNHTLAWV